MIRWMLQHDNWQWELILRIRTLPPTAKIDPTAFINGGPLKRLDEIDQPQQQENPLVLDVELERPGVKRGLPDWF